MLARTVREPNYKQNNAPSKVYTHTLAAPLAAAAASVEPPPAQPPARSR